MLSLLPLTLALAPLHSAPAQSGIESAVLAEINFARTRPRDYAERLRQYRKYFKGKIVWYPGNPTGLRTSEGTRAVDEAIRFLERQAPLAPIASADLLARAARDHAREQGPNGATGHISADGGNPRTRVQRRGGGDYVAEVITYGPPSAVEVVRQLIVDDAVPGRGHRKTLFAAEMVYAGVACGPHRDYRVMCVADLGRKPDGRP
ncbi:CAP domain-containing protein [Sphingomonas sp. R-74633]|nr:CAP domain-containing protein [Sphingomonas sp. R-74633]NYT39729.1 CAP domain-containing protein [Sphingomonas sp. R-74633]